MLSWPRGLSVQGPWPGLRVDVCLCVPGCACVPVCVCVCPCACARVRVCTHACERACMCGSVLLCVHACVRDTWWRVTGSDSGSVPNPDTLSVDAARTSPSDPLPTVTPATYMPLRALSVSPSVCLVLPQWAVERQPQPQHPALHCPVTCSVAAADGILPL